MTNPILKRICIAAASLLASLAHAQWHYIDLNPPGSVYSEIWGVSGTDQVGISDQTTLCCFAARWRGTPGSIELYSNAFTFYATDGKWRAGTSGGLAVVAHDLNTTATPLHFPPNATGTVARAVWNGTFGGETVTNGVASATLWTSFKSHIPATILHPKGAGASTVHAMHSNVQAGEVDGRAATWRGKSSTFVDRHPAGYFQSAIHGLQNSTAVGSALQWGYGIRRYAAVWDLAAGSFSVVHPYQYANSSLTGVSYVYASGWVQDWSGVQRAGIWDLVAGTFTDLHAYLPAMYAESAATSVWSAPGGATYVGGIAQVDGRPRAMLWHLPPPSP